MKKELIKMKAYEKSTGLTTLKMVFGGLGIVGGVWMILAPFVLNYGGATKFDATAKKQVPVDLSAVTASDIIAGVLLIALVGFALLTANNEAMAKFRFYAGMAVVAVGVYLLAAPYIFGLLDAASYMTLDVPNTNDQLLGILSIVIGGYATQQEFFPHEADTNEAYPVATSA